MMRSKYAKKGLLSFLVMMTLTSSVGATSTIITGVEDLPKQPTLTLDGEDSAILIEGAKAQANVPESANINVLSKEGAPRGISIQQDAKLVGKDVTITMKPMEGASHVRPVGLLARDGAMVELADIHVDVTLASTSQLDNPDKPDLNASAAESVNASYGIVVGYDQGDTDPNKKTNVTIKDGEVHISNTKDTIPGLQNKEKKGSLKTRYDISQQLSGIRVFREGGSEPTFTSTGNLKIFVNDHSTDEVGNKINYLVGVYVSGEKAKTIFNGNTEITVEARGENSAGIKIGGAGKTTEGASVIANGKLTLHTEKTTDAGAVRLLGGHSVFKITGENTNDTSLIQAGKEAIVFDTQDYLTVRKGILINTPISRNTDNVDSVVYLKNVALVSTNDEASLILALGRIVNDTLVEAGDGFFTKHFNNGTFAVKNAQFTLTGEQSRAVAPVKGWLIEMKSQVEGDGIEDETNPTLPASELTATIDDGAQVEGLVNKDAASNLHMHVNNGAIWKLATKAAGTDTEVSTTATASDITIGVGGKLDASATPAEKNNYILNLPSPKDGEPKGLLKNAGSITLVNDSYKDKLELQGNYVGNNGKLLMNLEWDKPGEKKEEESDSDRYPDTDYDPERDGVSHGDIFIIRGTAKGTTKVVAVGKGNKEAIIDGSIGSIADELERRSVVVVRVDTKEGSEENAFVGTAKTTGAGELQLKHKDTDQGRVYYWSIQALPEEKGTSIYNDVVPGYTLLPRVLTDMAIESMSTLHERRGENQVVTWDGFLQREEKSQQIWARYLGSARTVAGTRLGYDLNANGIQIGKDFSIRQDPERPGNYRLVGGYLTIMHGSAHYQDAYRTKDGQAAADLHTGTSKTNFYALGLTSTSYKASGAYVDYVGQIEWGDNSYQNAETGNLQQNSWGLGLSVETGKPKLVSKNERREMYLEPQAQLIYHYGHLSSFNDGVRAVEQGGYSQLTGRIGARLTYERMKEGQKSHYRQGYLVANLWHHFTGSPQVRIGDDVVESRLGRTVAEIGIGGQYYMGKDTYLYGDLRYMHGLGSGTKHGYRGTIGIKYTW